MQQNKCNHCIENDHYWLYSNPRKLRKKPSFFIYCTWRAWMTLGILCKSLLLTSLSPILGFPQNTFTDWTVCPVLQHHQNLQPTSVPTVKKKMTLQKEAVKNSTQSMYFHEKNLRVILMCYLHCSKDGLHENYLIGTLFFHLFLPKSKP